MSVYYKIIPELSVQFGNKPLVINTDGDKNSTLWNFCNELNIYSVSLNFLMAVCFLIGLVNWSDHDGPTTNMTLGLIYIIPNTIYLTLYIVYVAATKLYLLDYTTLCHKILLCLAIFICGVCHTGSIVYALATIGNMHLNFVFICPLIQILAYVVQFNIVYKMLNC